MLRKFIKGSEVIEKSLGYFPSFHDDIIEKVEISKEGITLYLTLQSYPKNIKSPKIRLKFLHLLSYSLEGDLFEDVGIILDINFNKKEDFIKTEILASLGISGIVKSKEVLIDFI